MSSSRYRALLGATVSAAVIALVVLAVGIGAGAKTPPSPPPGGQGATLVTAAAASTSTTATVATTVTKSPPPAPPSTAPRTTSPPAAPSKPFNPRPVTSAGALLAPPPKPDLRNETFLDCATLADPGWPSVDCRSGPVGSATFTYLSEFRDIGAYVPGRVYVFRQLADGRQQVVLQAIDDNGSLFLEYGVTAVFESAEGGGVGDLLVGFQLDGNRLALDLVGGTGTVTLHRELARGAVWPSPGQLDTWASSATDIWTHDTIVWASGGWRIVGEEVVNSYAVPQTPFNALLNPA
jgi:hypothetical protein